MDDVLALVFGIEFDCLCCVHVPNESLTKFLAFFYLFFSGAIIASKFDRYATNGITGFIVRELGRIAGVPVNEFVVRNDCPCGSTIGPMISARTGIRVVDAGMPQLSMHSCREVMGTSDLTHGKDVMLAFYNHFRSIDDKISTDIE